MIGWAVFPAVVMIAGTAQPLARDVAIADAVFALCPMVMSGDLDLRNAETLSQHGYVRIKGKARERWAQRTGEDFQILLGRQNGKPGCAVGFVTIDNAAAYERFYRTVRKRGFKPVGGRRAPAEANFRLDTLTSSEGPIGIIVMTREIGADASSSITVLPPVSAPADNS